MKTVFLVAGARPNFMKIAPILRAAKGCSGLQFKLVHTGQHYDREMSDVFFDELGIPPPDYSIGAGSGSHAEQTARIMVGFEQLCQSGKPDAVAVVGDVNSTLACAIVAKKLKLPVAHVEAGLRSGDMGMPEEINRIVTDSISDWLFVSERSAVDNLRREGKPEPIIHFVGHVMVDNLLHQVERLKDSDSESFETGSFKTAQQRETGYGVVTLHRQENVDDPVTMTRIARALEQISAELPLIFPVHPRTRNNLLRMGIDLGPRVHLVGPQPYMPFLDLWKDAVMVLTDSGGLQEETTVLGVPCITIRESTERPVTVEEGTNVLAGTDPGAIVAAARKVLRGDRKPAARPYLWDGRAAERIVGVLARDLAGIPPLQARERPSTASAIVA